MRSAWYLVNLLSAEDTLKIVIKGSALGGTNLADWLTGKMYALCNIQHVT